MSCPADSLSMGELSCYCMENKLGPVVNMYVELYEFTLDKVG
jgi:hypothetical protein